MVQKVIIVEDIDSISQSVNQVLESFGVSDITVVKYCDDAWTKIKAAAGRGVPYDLVITDLSFEKDYRDVALKGGEALVEAIHLTYPELKTIVYTIEDKPYRVKKIVETLGVMGYVVKGRRSIEKLKQAIQAVAAQVPYIDPELPHVQQESGFVSLDSYEIALLSQLATGLNQEEIGEYFHQQGIKPHSKSAIEKRIARLRDAFNARNLVHLISIAKDRGIL